MANAAKPGGNKQPPADKSALKCGDIGTYREQKKRKTNKQERDHVPATSSMLAAAEPHAKGLTLDQKKCFKRFIKMDALTIAIPKGTHVKYSRTCKGRGGQARIDEDAKDLKKAAEDDFATVQPQLSDDCATKYEAAKAAVLAQLPDKLIQDSKAKALKEC